jgi:type I restriction enzyme R subunit
VYWNLKDDAALRSASIDASGVAREAESLLARFSNASVNPDEQRKLRASLYRPLLGLSGDERARVVDLILSVLLDGGNAEA